MSDTFYVRKEGKVRGPCTFEDLKTLVGKKHLNKTDQVSTDQKTWQLAKKIDGLFPPPQKPVQPPRQEAAPTGQPVAANPKSPDLIEVRILDESDLELLPDEDTQWHYLVGEQTRGPVAGPQLRGMIQSGKLPRDTFVWNDALDNWIEAHQVPGLLPKPAQEIEFATFSGVVPAPGQESPTAPLASASLILGIAGVSLLPGLGCILAVIFGHLALGQIRASRPRLEGHGLALAGLILGYAGLAIMLLVFGIWLIITLVQ